MIKPIAEEQGYDIDFVCRLDLSKAQLSQEQLKRLLGYEIELYAKANNMKAHWYGKITCKNSTDIEQSYFHVTLCNSCSIGDTQSSARYE